MRCTKQTYLSEAHAEAEQKKVAAIFKKRGGRGYKFLEAYQCRDCGLWHLGRSFKTARRAANQFVKPAPQSKMPSTGDLRRKLNAWHANGNAVMTTSGVNGSQPLPD